MRKTLLFWAKVSPVWMVVAIMVVITVATPSAEAGLGRVPIFSSEEAGWNLYCGDYKSPVEISRRGGSSEAVLAIWCALSDDGSGEFVGIKSASAPFGPIGHEPEDALSCGGVVYYTLRNYEFNFFRMAKEEGFAPFLFDCLKWALKESGKDFSIPNLNALLGTNLRFDES